MRIEIATPDFFKLPPKKLRVEETPETGRVYFIYGGQIVAVGKPETFYPTGRATG